VGERGMTALATVLAQAEPDRVGSKVHPYSAHRIPILRTGYIANTPCTSRPGCLTRTPRGL